MTQAVQNPMAGWEPQLHPRDSHGRFRDKWGIPEAAKKLIQGILKHWNSPQFKSNDHAAAYADQLAKKKKRTPEQQASIDYFMTEEGNADIQSTLRVGKDDLPQVRNIDEMMTPLPHDVILTRVLGPDAFGLPPERMGEVEEWTGKLLMDHGYAPTNLTTPQEVPGPHITMSILAPHGTPAVVPGDGRAVILDREQPLRVTKVEPDGHGGLYVYAVVAPKQGNKEAPRALGKELAPGELSPAVEATPEELAKRGLDADGNPLPKGGAPAPVAAPAPGPLPGGPDAPLAREAPGGQPEAGPPGGNAPVHQGRADVAQQRIDQARAAGREPAKEDVRKAEQEKKLAEVAGTAPEPAPIEGPDRKPAFKTKNLEPGPEHPDKVKKREAARAAQQETAKAEAPAEAAAAVDELISKKADNGVIAQHLRAIAAGPKLDGIDDEDDRGALRDDLERAADAFQDDNPMEGKKIIRSLARATGVEMQGKAGEKTSFDPSVHDAVNSDGLNTGDQIEVIRPGAVMRRKDGALVHLDRAMVRRVGPAQEAPKAPEPPKERVGFGAPKVSQQGRRQAFEEMKRARVQEGPAVPESMARARGEAAKKAAREVEVENRIRAAYDQTPKLPGGGVEIKELRKNLSDMPRDEVDAALIRLGRKDRVSLLPNEDQGRLTTADKAAAVEMPNGGAPGHFLVIDDGNAQRPVPSAPKAKPVPRKAGRPAAGPKVFNEEDLDKNNVAQLRQHAKQKGVVVPAGTRKADIIDLIKAGPKEKAPRKAAKAAKAAVPKTPVRRAHPEPPPESVPSQHGRIKAQHKQRLVEGLDRMVADGKKRFGSLFEDSAAMDPNQSPRAILERLRDDVESGDVKDWDTVHRVFGSLAHRAPNRDPALAKFYGEHKDKINAELAKPVPRKAVKKAIPRGLTQVPYVHKANNIDDLREIVGGLRQRDAKNDEIFKEIDNATKHLDTVQIAALRGRLLAHEQLNDRTITRTLAQIIEERDKKQAPDLNKMLVKDLRELAKKKGVKIPAGARKADIIRLLGARSESAMPADGLDAMDLRDLRDLAMEHEISGAEHMAEPRLIQELRKLGVARPKHLAPEERFPTFDDGAGAPTGNVALENPFYVQRHELQPGDEIELTDRVGPDGRVVRGEVRRVKSVDGVDVQLDDGSWLLDRDRQKLLSRRKGVKPPVPPINKWDVNGMDMAPMQKLAKQHGLPFEGKNRAQLREALFDAAEAQVAKRIVEDHAASVPGAGVLNDLQENQLIELFDENDMTVPFGVYTRRDLIKEALRRGLVADVNEMNVKQLRAALEARHGLVVPSDLSRDQLLELMKNPPVMQFHAEVAPDVKKLIDSVASGIERRNELGGGAMGETYKAEMSDGGEAVQKIHHKAFGVVARQQADAEQLASLVGQALGARNPAVYRADGKTIFMEWVPGRTADNSNRDRIDEAMDRPEARGIGLLDLLAINGDRHGGNWMISPDKRPVPIDHGLAWNDHATTDTDVHSSFSSDSYGPFAYRWLSGYWSMDSDEKAEVRAKLEALRPQFIMLGREAWLDFSLARLDSL